MNDFEELPYGPLDPESFEPETGSSETCYEILSKKIGRRMLMVCMNGEWYSEKCSWLKGMYVSIKNYFFPPKPRTL